MTNISTAELHGRVQPGRVHRRVYADPAIFDLEMERIFGRQWIYVGHESQVKRPGDFFRSRVGRQPVALCHRIHRDQRLALLFVRRRQPFLL